MPTLVFRENTIAYDLGEHEPPEDAKQLVFVPGVNGSLQWWEHHLHELSRWHDTYALEFPGHGESTGPACDSVTAFRDCLGEFLTGMAVEPAVIVGHSVGAMAALSLAAHSPDMVEALVLISMHSKWQPDPERLNELAQTAETGVAPSFDESIFSSHATEHMLRWGQRHMERSTAESLLHDFTACTSYDPMQDLARVSQPTLFMLGDSDPRMAPEEAYALASMMDHAEVSVIANSGYLPMVEQRQAFQDRLQTFTTSL